MLAPHLSGSEGHEAARLADGALDELERLVRGLPPLHAVTRDDLPTSA